MSSCAFIYRQNRGTTRRDRFPFLLPPAQRAPQSVQGEINGAMLIKVRCPGTGAKCPKGYGGIHGKTSPGKLRLSRSIRLGVSRKLEISPDAATGSTNASFPNWCKPIVVNVDGRTPTNRPICSEMGPQSGTRTKADLPLICRQIVLTTPTSFPGTVRLSLSWFRKIIRKDPVLREDDLLSCARNKRGALNPARNVCYAKNPGKQLSHSGCIKLSSFLHNPCRLTPAGVFLVPGNPTPKTNKIPLQGKSGRCRGLAYSLHILAQECIIMQKASCMKNGETQKSEKFPPKTWHRRPGHAPGHEARIHNHNHNHNHNHTPPVQGTHPCGKGERVTQLKRG